MTSDGWIDGRFGCAIGCHCYVNQLSSRVNVHVNALMLVMNMSSMYVYVYFIFSTGLCE